MGLSTSHDCFQAPYSTFMEWREELHKYLKLSQIQTLHDAWSSGFYDDQTKPINVLMRHSDCDGIIEASVCGPLADALEKIHEKMPDTGIPEIFSTACPKANTKQFIKGLRLAASKNEDVVF